MPLKLSLEIAAITLPLDIVMKLCREARSGMSEEEVALLKIEVASVLSHIDSLEDEVMDALMRDTFG